ncbi:class I SAM-dependent methyltransferase [Paenarthrobacter sp. NPDC058040]|uniref:class I SAM-dependent methyltransferase n=1 Tax=unclassified Paenarthrobacter TaxID=2634190 RepID=UPI0036DED83D
MDADDLAFSEFTKLRSAAVRTLSGRVLEIGSGRGANFADLDSTVEWIGLEPGARTHAALSANARKHGHRREPLLATAEAIPLADNSVDAVLGTFVFCSVDDPNQAAAEAWRVLIPGGRIVLVDHVLSQSNAVSRFQRAASPISAALNRGCRWDREMALHAEGAGFQTVDIRRYRVSTGIPGVRVPCTIYEGLKV